MADDDGKVSIEVFRASAPPERQRRHGYLEFGVVRGNSGSLVVLILTAGEEAEHHHEQEHVGAVLEGSFAFVIDGREVACRAGDLYRVPADVPHGVRCSGSATVVQVRSDVVR